MGVKDIRRNRMNLQGCLKLFFKSPVTKIGIFELPNKLNLWIALPHQLADT